MSANDFLLDAGIRHQIFVQRYAGGQVKELLGYLRDMVADVERKLLEAQTLSEAQRLTTQLREIQNVIDDGLERMNRGLLDSVSDLAEYEAEFAVKTLNAASTVDACARGFAPLCHRCANCPDFVRSVSTDSNSSCASGLSSIKLNIRCLNIAF